MQGIAVGRAVDLTQFSGYGDLRRKLEEMFEIKGELCGPTMRWKVVYTDDENDMMMVGDDPWQLSQYNLYIFSGQLIALGFCSVTLGIPLFLRMIYIST